ncbi:hypothetical protein [Aquipuribacter sp. MA13-6]|uniref:hypothetical protein n=1 Tax=unclassified Aquipuribacter TaxID=2635084 RepID=UPI003EED0641
MVPRVVPTAVAALGLVLLLTGVVMLTLAAPPQQVGGDAQAAPVLLTGPGVLALTGEAVDVAVAGDGFVGLARSQEVAAWVDGVAHTRVDGVDAELEPGTTVVDGAAPGLVSPAADPALADIWLQEESGASPSLRVDSPRPDQTVVVVAGTTSSVTLTWQRPATHPGAWPLLVVGALQLVLGTAWLVALNRRRIRRDRLSRRDDRVPTTTRRPR